MANRFYSVDRGETAATVAAATSGRDIELIVDDAVGVTKEDIYRAFIIFEKAVLEDKGFTD